MSSQINAPAGLNSIAQAAKDNAASGEGLPPVEKWNPPFCGDLDIRIKADGLWHYLKSPIGRPELVRLFSTVLRRDEDDKYYLVTPVEKIGIVVDDAPFLGVDISAEGSGPEQILRVTTNVGDVVSIDKDHPIRFEREDNTDGLKPYIHVRGRLDALLNRAMFYELVKLAQNHDLDGDTWLGVWSGGEFFPMQRADELDL